MIMITLFKKRYLHFGDKVPEKRNNLVVSY